MSTCLPFLGEQQPLCTSVCYCEMCSGRFSARGPSEPLPLPSCSSGLCACSSVLSVCARSEEWAAVVSHGEGIGGTPPGPGELHRREVCFLSEPHRLLRPLHRRGVLQSPGQRQGGGGTWIYFFYSALCTYLIYSYMRICTWFNIWDHFETQYDSCSYF